MKTPEPSQSARADLSRLINGFQVSQAIHVAASLGIADLIGSDVRACIDLALATGTDAASLYRLMRTLAAVGVFREHEGRGFSLTPAGSYLRSDVEGTQAQVAIMIGRANFWQSWGNLIHSVRTGDIAFDHVHGSDVWTYRSKHPVESAIFDRAMAAGTERFADAVLRVCDFSRFHHVIDVGGGDGAFLAKILAAYPLMRGTLFDQPHVVAKADKALAARELAERCEVRSGDFFASVPEGGDAYLLKWILHDWDDTSSIKILRTCRNAVPAGGRLLLVEFLVGPPNTCPEAKFMDLMMMVMNGGRERTLNEFESLLASAGFCIDRVTPTPNLLSLIECVRRSD